MSVSRRRDVFGLAAFVVMCFGVSLLGGRAAQPALAHWYPELSKPDWTPPVWVFGPIWTLLYPMLAVAGWLAWREGRSRGGTLLFLLQLTLNAAWPWIFFAERRLGCGARVRRGAVARDPGTMRAFWARGHKGAALLMLPYLGWVSFATALTAAIWWAS